MAYSTALNTNVLGRVGAQNDFSPTVWTYTTADALTTVDTTGYFNAVANKLKVGDLIYCYTTTGPAAGLAFVSSNTRNLAASPPVAGVVNVTNFTAIGTVNSD